ncbi:MAG: hypothetical protein GC179_21580 [Anaerolineaceae bacterium]|nr:hypothetical protein [Anaerolineaceae bacterium]
MGLVPWLDDIKNIIVSKQLTSSVTCKVLDSTLIITDCIAGEYSVSAESIAGRDIVLILPVGLPVSKSDPNFMKFDNFIRALARDKRMILVDENRGGYRKYGVGVRFAWTTNLTELSNLTDHNLSLHRRFYINCGDLIVQKYMEWELDVIHDEQFDNLPLESDNYLI